MPEGGNIKERGQNAAEHRRMALDMANRLEELERGHPTKAHLRKLLADISTRVNGRRLEFTPTLARQGPTKNKPNRHTPELAGLTS